jgi:excinuclease ABC subunit A
MEVVKCADWVIDLGPEGGDEGGNLVFEGTPEQLAKSKAGFTGKYLKEKLS